MVNVTQEELEHILKGRTLRPGLSKNASAPPFAAPAAKGRVPELKMNKLESAYAELLAGRTLAGEVRWWRYEAVKLKLADHTFYTPDFVIQLANLELEFHETKGWMRDDANVKIKVAAEQYPLFRFVLCKKDKSGWSFRQI